MDHWPEVVITGLGVVSPIGVGCETFWHSLCHGQSGICKIEVLNGYDWPFSIGGCIRGLDLKDRIRPRKALKVMSRDIQLGFLAADLAIEMAHLAPGHVAAERLGIVFGADLIPCDLQEIAAAVRACIVDGRFEFSQWGPRAMSELYPLWLLKYLPNMPACHIGIAHDARGPNNTLTLAEVSSLASVAEAVRVIQRGDADVMIAGGTGSSVHPSIWVREKAYQLSRRIDAPSEACRPFDADRDGMVHGEGAGALVLERREFAQARGANILAQVLGCACACEPRRFTQLHTGEAIRQAILQVMQRAGLRRQEIGHVNAHGLGTIDDDIIEAQAIRSVLDDVPVTAPKSFFGNLVAGTGAVELAASVLGLMHGVIPFTLNYEKSDPRCPVNVVAQAPAPSKQSTALILNHTRTGQAAALLIARQ